MKVTYCSGGLVKVELDGINYQLENAYQLIQQRISHFTKFSSARDAQYVAVLLTLEQRYPDRKRTDADQTIITRVNQQRNLALNP
jgi:hypothetical protein